jgi:hypothetical protein
MPGFFQNALNAVAHVGDEVVKHVGSVGSEHFGARCGNGSREAGRKRNVLAMETYGLCESTISKSQQMLEFCQDLNETFSSTTDGGVSAEAFERIQEQLCGNKVQSAM